MPDALIEVEGRELKLSNLEKVLYPEAHFTKAEVVDYYVRVAEAMLPHLSGRTLTFRRFPDGVEGESFFEKRCPSHRPEWVNVAPGPGDNQGPINYCVLDSLPSLVWAANLAALELHAPMALARDQDSPTMVVFDLDPGAPADIVSCAAVACRIRELLETLGLAAFPKTSGSKGLQLYLPLNTPADYPLTKGFATAVARVFE
jgi:bifunctional non-homologous end joining protein LigD